MSTLNIRNQRGTGDILPRGLLWEKTGLGKFSYPGVNIGMKD